MTLYTVQRARKDDTLYGPSHGADGDDHTVCGQAIDHHWWITNNTFDGVITCRQCQKRLELYPTIPERMQNRARTG
jgi:hypothetical protein